MILLDAYALVALVAEEPAANEVESILRRGDARVVIVNLAETIVTSQRTYGFSPDEIRNVLEPLLLGGAMAPLVSGEQHAWLAAELRAKHYDRKTSALSLADCFLLAHALDEGADVATSDPPLAAVGRAEGIRIAALPDSAGATP